MRQFTSRCIVLLAASLAGAATLFGQAPEGPMVPKPGQPVQQAPAGAQGKVRVRVTLVNTPVTVQNARGDMVNDLEAKDFLVTDNGIEQKITHFDLGGDPVSMVVLIETSSRIESILPEIRKTGILFTQTVMGPNGEGAVVGFNDSIDKLQDFTANGDLIENAVAGLQTGTSGARLFDAMAVGVEMLSDRPQATAEKPGRRRVLLVMSESLDRGSETKFGDVLRKAQLANVTIYSVGLSTTRTEWHDNEREGPSPITPPGVNSMPPPPGTAPTPSVEAESQGEGADLLGLAVWAVQHVDGRVKAHPLEVATTATGGAFIATYKDHSIEKAIDEIGGELHAQYTIGYMPTDANDIGYHEIRVQVDRKHLTVRARPGYYIAPPES